MPHKLLFFIVYIKHGRSKVSALLRRPSRLWTVSLRRRLGKEMMRNICRISKNDHIPEDTSNTSFGMSVLQLCRQRMSNSFQQKLCESARASLGW